LPDTAPGAGKLLVTFFQKLRKDLNEISLDLALMHTSFWQRWIRAGLANHPDCIENVKNYLFPPLFKLDRIGSIEFLERLAQQTDFTGFRNLESHDWDAQAFLLLSAMEAGKKAGLVDEPGKREDYHFRLKIADFFRYLFSKSSYEASYIHHST